MTRSFGVEARARVLTTDKDLCQLVREDGRIVVHDLAKEQTFDADGVRAKFGVSPAQIPDFLGLVGRHDRQPAGRARGRREIGGGVLSVFDSIDGVPADVESWGAVSVRGAKRLAEKIAEHRDRALKTKELATVAARSCRA